jgi:hypothetical protein
MNELVKFAQVLALSWAALAPVWVLILAAQVWGRTVLAKDDVVKGLAWTLGTSVAAFPVMWAVLRYFAGFNPAPKSSAMVIGGRFAALLLPIYSALLACVAFEFRIQAARKRGAPARALAVRVVAGIVLTVTVFLALVALGVGALFSAGPKVFG